GGTARPGAAGRADRGCPRHRPSGRRGGGPPGDGGQRGAADRRPAAAVTSLLDEVVDLVRIPSVSTGGGDPAALRQAAGWLAERIDAAGGDVALVETPGNPLVVGDLPSARADAPTVLIYGHYDVQGP